ncbi:hypothetical protein ACT40E_03760 [Acinetobacter baumannii]
MNFNNWRSSGRFDGDGQKDLTGAPVVEFQDGGDDSFPSDVDAEWQS